MDFSRSGNLIRRAWDTLSPLPGGRLLFSKLVGTINPYTGSIGARVRQLSPGYAEATVRERRRVRNHVKSVHAIALVNLAEMTSGLALMAGLPPRVRGLPIDLRIRYHHKGRGVITATCRCDPPNTVERKQEVTLHTDLRDPSGTLVADATAIWAVEKI